jgi:hypothetical protein
MADKYTKWTENLPNDKNIPKSSFARPSHICPNWDLWFENIPSGNPALQNIEQSSFVDNVLNYYVFFVHLCMYVYFISAAHCLELNAMWLL